MVLGFIIFNIETSQLLYNNFYFEEENDFNKYTRIQCMIRKIMNDFIYKKQTMKDKSRILSFVNENSQIFFDKNLISKIQNKLYFL